MKTNRAPLVRLYDDEDVIDGFAGGGGTSEGVTMALGRPPAVAINHDAEALAMHEANHPETRHIRSNIRFVRYENVLEPGRRCGVAWFSPDCTFHSKARGGKPFRDPQRARRIRGLGWEAVRCAKELHAATPPGEPSRAPRIIVLENVEEWKDWCPVLADGTPDWSRRSENYRRWKRELANAGPGYVIEDRELVACDYGSPTRRKRLFVIARCDGQPIVWPEPTHGPGREHPYRTAAECIDFSLAVPSIFLTPKQAKAWGKAHGVPAPKRPLVKATKRRIARGVFRFVLDCPEPFIVNNLTNNVPRPVSEPLATTLTGNHKYLVTPFVAKYHHPTSEGGERGQDLRDPLATLDTSNRFALVRITLVPRDSIDATYVDRAVQTCAFLVKYFGTGVARPIDQPLGTLTTKDRIGLVEVVMMRVGDREWVLADIGMRMLTPRELFLCQGFPPDYEIDSVPVETPLGLKGRKPLTKKAQTRLVGNSVPPHVAAAIIRANLAAPSSEAWRSEATA